MKTGSEESALYVYAIAAQDRLRSLFGRGGLPDGLQDGNPLALVTQADLAAVVSEVPLRQFGEDRFEESLKNVGWAAEKVMRHEKITEFLAAEVAVVPLRFGVMYSMPEKIRSMLAERSARLHEILREIENREEWGLSVHVDRKKLQASMAQLSSKLAEMQRQAAASAPGQRYLLEKKLDALRVSESKAEISRVIQEIRASLAAESHSVKPVPIRSEEAKQEPVVAGKFAFLIDRAGLRNFRQAAEKAAGKYAPYGFTMDLTGPWPPYNFSE